MLILNFPGNPTSQCVELDFFEKIIAVAKENNIWVVQDIAYADIVFDGYKAPSILQVKGAKDIAVEFSPCPKAITCRVGASVLCAVTKNWFLRWRGLNPI